MYETKEKVFLFHVETDNTIDKIIFCIIDDEKLKYWYRDDQVNLLEVGQVNDCDNFLYILKTSTISLHLIIINPRLE